MLCDYHFFLNFFLKSVSKRKCKIYFTASCPNHDVSSRYGTIKCILTYCKRSHIIKCENTANKLESILANSQTVSNITTCCLVPRDSYISFVFRIRPWPPPRYDRDFDNVKLELRNDTTNETLCTVSILLRKVVSYKQPKYLSYNFPL